MVDSVSPISPAFLSGHNKSIQREDFSFFLLEAALLRIFIRYLVLLSYSQVNLDVMANFQAALRNRQFGNSAT